MFSIFINQMKSKNEYAQLYSWKVRQELWMWICPTYLVYTVCHQGMNYLDTGRLRHTQPPSRHTDLTLYTGLHRTTLKTIKNRSYNWISTAMKTVANGCLLQPVSFSCWQRLHRQRECSMQMLLLTMQTPQWW